MSMDGNTRTRGRRAPDARYPFVCACGRASQTDVCGGCVEAHRIRNNLCEDCGKPSPTRRCRDCNAKIDAASGRYRGRGENGKRGGSTYLDQDLTELRYAWQELGKAYHGIEHLRDRGEVPKRDYNQAMLDPLAWLKLSLRLIQSVIDRHPKRPGQ